MKLVYQRTKQRQNHLRNLRDRGIDTGTWLSAYQSFVKRLHWRAHFMQKLEDHAEDPRSEVYTWEELVRGQTDDRLWDLCQRWLRHRGELHNNLRMTWAKQLLKWTEDPRTALQWAIDLNNRFALDGRDPNSYLGILWCFGFFDRPYDEDRNIIGRLRPRTTDWHASRLDLDQLRNIATHTTAPDHSVAIVGAGWSGTACGRVLLDHGVSVSLFEKSRGHGGRSATRYVEDDATTTLDHGAQYFTKRDERLTNYYQSWCRRGLIGRWDVSPVVLKDGEVQERKKNENRWVGVPTMNEPVKHLASDLEVELETTVADVVSGESGWILNTDDGREQPFDRVVLTAPPEQSRELLGSHCADLRNRMSTVSMPPTWCLGIVFQSSLDVDWEAAFVNDCSPVDWMARNQTKSGRGPAESLVIHADHDWSSQNLEREPDWIHEELMKVVLDWLSVEPDRIQTSFVHRWRYAKPEDSLDQDFLEESGVLVAGDWLSGGRVEGALVSGRAAAGRILRDL